MKITQQAVDAKAGMTHAGQLKLRPVGDVEQVAIAYADRMAYGRTAEEVE